MNLTGGQTANIFYLISVNLPKFPFWDTMVHHVYKEIYVVDFLVRNILYATQSRKFFLSRMSNLNQTESTTHFYH